MPGPLSFPELPGCFWGVEPTAAEAREAVRPLTFDRLEQLSTGSQHLISALQRYKRIVDNEWWRRAGETQQHQQQQVSEQEQQQVSEPDHEGKAS